MTSPTRKMPTRGLSLIEKVEFYLPNRGDGCWLWTGTVNRYGYGQTKHHGHQDLAHRVVYRAWVGEIPEGRTIDHECHNLAYQRGECQGGDGCLHRRCCNPDHLVPRTMWENTKRGNAVTAPRAPSPTCSEGHEYTPENTYINKLGHRTCRACRAAYMREYRSRR
jgi:hypothetical protein